MQAVIAEAAYAWFQQHDMLDEWPGDAVTILALPLEQRESLNRYVGEALLRAGCRGQHGGFP